MLGLMYLFILYIYLKAFGYQAVTHLCIAIWWDEDIMCITAAVMCIVVTIVPVLEQRSHSANIINVPSIWRPPLI